MLTTPTLDTEQIEAFSRDGFLVVRSAFGQSDMDRIEAWCQELVDWPEVSGRHWVFHERSLKGDDRDLIQRIENITPFHDGFKSLTEALAAPVGQLLGEDAVLFKEKINFKMPGGDGFKPHQDSQAGWDKYADFFVSVLLSIDAATTENGCLKIAKGHHQRGLYRSWEPLTEADMDGMQLDPVPTERGDLIFFDCYAPHASDPNLSDDIRRIYYATYNRASAGDHMAQYYADKHANFPPDIDRDPNRTYQFLV